MVKSCLYEQTTEVWLADWSGWGVSSRKYKELYFMNDSNWWPSTVVVNPLKGILLHLPIFCKALAGKPWAKNLMLLRNEFSQPKKLIDIYPPPTRLPLGHATSQPSKYQLIYRLHLAKKQTCIIKDNTSYGYKSLCIKI